jgi:hypothetical protein
MTDAPKSVAMRFIPRHLEAYEIHTRRRVVVDERERALMNQCMKALRAEQASPTTASAADSIPSLMPKVNAIVAVRYAAHPLLSAQASRSQSKTRQVRVSFPHCKVSALLVP